MPAVSAFDTETIVAEVAGYDAPIEATTETIAPLSGPLTVGGWEYPVAVELPLGISTGGTHATPIAHAQPGGRLRWYVNEWWQGDNQYSAVPTRTQINAANFLVVEYSHAPPAGNQLVLHLNSSAWNATFAQAMALPEQHRVVVTADGTSTRFVFDLRAPYSKATQTGANAFDDERGDFSLIINTQNNFGPDPGTAVATRAFLANTRTEVPTGPNPVLFDHTREGNSGWAPELGRIVYHTPSPGVLVNPSTITYLPNGMIEITNNVPVSRDIFFRFVFEHVVDMRGFDAVVMELDEAPTDWFASKLRFRIDQDIAYPSAAHTNRIVMSRTTGSGNVDGMVGMSDGHWDYERLRGIGALPAAGETVRIRRIYLQGDGVLEAPTSIAAPNVWPADSPRNIVDIVPPRTGNTPVTQLTTSSRYTGTVAWEPNHPTFRAGYEYTAHITLTPREGWTLEGIPANWFRINLPTGNNAANTLTHEANSGTFSHTFPRTIPAVPYPEPTQFVAFTIDDTPSASTAALMDVIEALDIDVTFFVSGINLEQAKAAPRFGMQHNPAFAAQVDRILDGGHELASHAWQHERFGNTADLDVAHADFLAARQTIHYFTGANTPWIRIPYNSHQAPTLGVAGNLNQTNLRGLTVDDWDIYSSASWLVHRVVSQTSAANRARDGQIYVAHDQADQTNLAQALPEIVHQLRSRGIDFMTVSDLREHRNFNVEYGRNYPNFFTTGVGNPMGGGGTAEPFITIGTHPVAPADPFREGNISGSLSVAATAPAAAGTPLTFQWRFASWDNGSTDIPGATDATLTIPTDLPAGMHYIYCVVSAPNAASVTTNVIPISVLSTDRVLFCHEDGWDPVLGHIFVHTPGGGSTSTRLPNGMLELTNNVPASRNVPFRFVFEHLLDMRDYDRVVIELESAPVGWFAGVLRFRVDQETAWPGTAHTNRIEMVRNTGSGNVDGLVGMDPGNWDLERLRGVGVLPSFGETVRISRIYLTAPAGYTFEARSVNSPHGWPHTNNANPANNFHNLADILPPRTGNVPVTDITTSSRYTGSVVWAPDHAVFQPGVEYTATITLTARSGWTMAGVPANTMRIFNPFTAGNAAAINAAAATTHPAGVDGEPLVITRAFPATVPASPSVPYAELDEFIAFKFDDTPSMQTNALMDVIEAIQARYPDFRVSFAVSGINLARALPTHPQHEPSFAVAMQRIIDGGHEIVSHAYQHERWGAGADVDVRRADFDRVQDLIYTFTGIDTPWFVPNYSHVGGGLLDTLEDMGLTSIVGWQTNDWNIYSSPSWLVSAALTATGNNMLRCGQIYVAHDQPGQWNMIQALPELVYQFHSRGFGFKTITDLAEHRGFPQVPGVQHSNFFATHNTIFNLQGGNIDGVTANVTIPVNRSASPTPPANPVRNGFRFTGWFDAAADPPDGPAMAPITEWDDIVILANRTFHARWTPAHNVTFHLQGGNINGETDPFIEAVAHNTAPNPPDPVRDGHRFLGWATTATGPVLETLPVIWEVVVGPWPITFYARWVQVHEVSFNLQGGNIDGETDPVIMTVDHNTAPTAPAAPVRTGHRFLGWAETATGPVLETLPVIGEPPMITFYARWVQEHRVSFNLQGGIRTGGGELEQIIDHGTTPTAPTATRDGHRFLGWATMTTGPVLETLPAITAPATFHARWVQEHTVTFNLAGGTRTGGGELVQTVPHGGAAVAPTVTHEGYTFAGWDRAFDNVTGTITVTAQWTPIPPTLSVLPSPITVNDGNLVVTSEVGGTAMGNIALDTAALPAGVTALANQTTGVITVTGVRPAHGQPAITGTFTVPVTRDGITENLVINVNLTPLEVSTHDVTFELAGGNVDGDTEDIVHAVAPGAAIGADNVPVPVRANYSFVGWQIADSDEILSAAEVAEIEVDDPITFVAVWRPGRQAFMIGTPDGIVNPGGSITRAGVATILFRLITDEARYDYWEQDNPFPDVELEHWFNNAVSTMTNAEIFTGFPDGTFAPNQTITRAELAVAVVRFMDASDEDVPAATFTDIGGHWAAHYISIAASKGWIQGPDGPTGPFNPDLPITRAETATLINQAFDRLVYDVDDLHEDMLTWPDNEDEDAWYFIHIQAATNSYTYERREDGEFKIWLSIIDPREWWRLERPDSTPNSIFDVD